jgi:hypothetical protein
MAEKENQHTVPQFYLRQFTPDVGDKIIWQFSKIAQDRPRRKSPANAASESHFYSLQRDDGTWDGSLEDELSEAENNAAPAFRRLIQDGHSVARNRLVISNFIGLMYLRSKAMRDHAVAQAARIKSPQITINFIKGDFDYLSKQSGRERGRHRYAKELSSSKAFSTN